MLRQVTCELLASRVTEGHPARVREVLLVFEAAGAFTSQAEEARASLSQVASAYLAARLADASPNVPLLVEAIFEAEAESLSEQAAEARAQLPQLVTVSLHPLSTVSLLNPHLFLLLLSPPNS